MGLTLIFSASGFAQPASAAKGNAAEFMRKIVGEWVGTCEQSTDGQRAEDKYFHANIKQADASTFSTTFDYYRCDEKTGAPIKIGSDVVTTNVGSDGTIKAKIAGKGVIMVDKRPKDQQHELNEILTASPNGLQGTGTGKISVGGMPLGLGKNGKVKSDKSTWSLNNGVLTISQSLVAGFRALFINKSFNVDAKYVAKRGTDVAMVLPKPTQISARPASNAAGHK